MTKERRNDERIPTNFQVRWKGRSGSHEGRIEDISRGGCFVNTAEPVEIGEIIGLEIRLRSGKLLQLRGETVFHQNGVGFGLLFNFLSDEEEQALKQLIA